MVTGPLGAHGPHVQFPVHQPVVVLLVGHGREPGIVQILSLNMTESSVTGILWKLTLVLSLQHVQV